jgi:predicted ATPase with chaperone activity
MNGALGNTAPAVDTTPAESSEAAVPVCPLTLDETGLKEGFIADLLLKTLFQRGTTEGEELARLLSLAYPVLDDLLLTLQQRHFLEVLGTKGHGRAGYTFGLTDQGQTRARLAMDASQYVGPAPVPLALFRAWVERQTVRHVRVRRQALIEAFEDLVFPDAVFDSLGPAVNSGSSIFLHGAPGNGKTAIAERLGKLVFESIWLPKAVLVGGHVMTLEDPVYHHRIDPDTGGGTSLLRQETSCDHRFAHVRRPAVFVGGELTLDQLDLKYDPYSKVYQAPFQLKATGGVLVIDDFGRQRMSPAELLNRWIVPLEKHFDVLSLHTGTKFPVPFDCLLVFATNLNPRDLVDEAFLRRIQFKVEIRSPDKHAFTRILAMECEARGMRFDPQAVHLLFRDYYEPMGFPPRGCHPRDLIHQIESLAEFRGVEPTLEPELLHKAAQSYFLLMEEEYVAGIPSLHTRRTT